ncbi:MAG: hypothetical protein PHH32_03210 [Eubacteriales bacterium]|nr:hypothetical protein [Eubacteriales bacterium]
MIRQWISRIRRWYDRRREPRAVTITTEQWALYLNNQQYRERRSHLYGLRH